MIEKIAHGLEKHRYKMAFAMVVVAMFMFSGALSFTSLSQSSHSNNTNSSQITNSASITYQNEVVSLGLVRDSTFPSLNQLAPVNVHPFIAELYLGFGYESYAPSPTYRMQLGQSLTSSNNYTTWTMELKPNLKWDNGQPLTSTDLNYTLYMEEQLHYFDFVKSQTIINSTTVELTLNYSDPGFLNSLISTVILPYATFHSVPISQMKSFTNFNNIIADGPYVIYNYTSGENPILMSPNPYYYEGPPHVKGVDLYLYSSKTACESALEAGEIDAGGGGGTATEFAPLSSIAGYSAYPVVPSNYKAIVFNYNTALFNNTTFRQALAYATPRQFISDSVYGPNPTIPAWSTETVADAALNFSPSSIPTYHYNLSMTTKLMESLGYKLSSGLWVNSSTGAKVNINLIFPSDQPGSASVATLLSVNWTQAGFSVTTQPIVESTFYSTLISEKWQVAIFSNFGATVSTIPLDFNISQSGYNLFNGNGTQWFNNTYRKAVEQATILSPTSAQAAADMRTAALIEAEHVIVIPLYEEMGWAVVNNNFNWGNQTNHTGIFNTQVVVARYLWPGALYDLQYTGKAPSKPSTGISAIDYAIIGIVVAVVVVAAVAGVVVSRSKKDKSKERD